MTVITLVLSPTKSHYYIFSIVAENDLEIFSIPGELFKTNGCLDWSRINSKLGSRKLDRDISEKSDVGIGWL